jgi:hypothetical protein
MGEGWGLVSSEHGAAGAAQIVPDHTACAELWRGRGELIPLDRSYIPEFSVLEMGEVSTDGVAQSLIFIAMRIAGAVGVPSGAESSVLLGSHRARVRAVFRDTGKGLDGLIGAQPYKEPACPLHHPT